MELKCRELTSLALFDKMNAKSLKGRAERKVGAKEGGWKRRRERKAWRGRLGRSTYLLPH